MTHYIHDENNNRIEGMSKEEIYALLAEAIQTGQLPSVDEDTAFVTMFKSIVDGKTYKMAFCTQAQYNQLEAQGLLVADAYYIITDDETYDDIIAYIDNTAATLQNNIDTKVSTDYVDDEISQYIHNNSSGIVLYSNDYHDDDSPTGQIKVNSGGVEIRGESYNHGDDDVDYRCKLNIYDTDIIVSKDLGEGVESYNLINELRQVETNKSDIAALTPKTLYTNNNNYNLTPSNWVTLNLSETITNTSILELYATLRINDNTVYTKFNGKVQLSSNLFTDVFISFPMFNYGAGSGQAIGMVVIYVRYNGTTSVQVKLDTLGIANSSIFVNSLPTAFNAKIDKILLINN